MITCERQPVVAWGHPPLLEEYELDASASLNNMFPWYSTNLFGDAARPTYDYSHLPEVVNPTARFDQNAHYYLGRISLLS